MNGGKATNMDRIRKAIKYINGHISKKTYIDSKKTIIADIVKFKKSSSVSVHAPSHQFVKVLQNRFPNGFYPDEYLLIINSVSGKLTNNQKEYARRN